MQVVPKRTLFHIGRLFLYISALLYIYIPRLDYLMTESVCFWYNHLGILCPMCGGTRSFLNFMHFRFADAFSYNSALTLGVYPIMLFLVLQDIYCILANTFFNKNNVSLLLYFMNLFNRRSV